MNGRIEVFNFKEYDLEKKDRRGTQKYPIAVREDSALLPKGGPDWHLSGKLVVDRPKFIVGQLWTTDSRYIEGENE